MHREPYRLVILGAGFSVPAGLPLARELSREVLRRSYRRETFYHLNRDIDRYRDYERLRTGKRPNRNDVDIERLLAFLDIEHYLALKGSDTWSDEGNKGQLAAKALLAGILVERQAAMSSNQWSVYLKFAEALRPHDEVVTFNYDTILEEACERVGKPFRLCPWRYKTMNDWGGTIDSSVHEVVVRKVHGSVDWYSSKQYLEQKLHHEKNPTTSARPYSNARIFEHKAELGVERLVREPYSPDDPLYYMVRARNVRNLVHPDGIWPPPFLVSPSASKIVYLKPLVDLWRGFNNAGWMQSQMIVIGFSFSAFDDYVLVPLIGAIDGFQTGTEKWSSYGRTRLKVVDFQPTANERRRFRRRVKWISWRRTNAFWRGLTVEDIPTILEPSTFDEKRWNRRHRPDVPTSQLDNAYQSTPARTTHVAKPK